MLDALVAKPLVTDDPLAAPLRRDVKQAEVARDRLLQPIAESAAETLLVLGPT